MIAEVSYALLWFVLGVTFSLWVQWLAAIRSPRTRLHVPTVRQIRRAQRNAKAQLVADRQHQQLRLVRPGDVR